MEVYIIRHGETVWNSEGKLQGRVDIELNENGRAAALKLSEELKTVEFDCIYSSPLKRAYETALLIRGDRDIPIIKDDRLREISFGCMEGVHYSVWANENSPFHNFFIAPAQYQPPEEAESLQSIINRTREFLKTVIEPLEKNHKRIMIVAHGATNKGLMCYIENKCIDNFWGNGLQKNCEADIFLYENNIWTRK